MNRNNNLSQFSPRRSIPKHHRFSIQKEAPNKDNFNYQQFWDNKNQKTITDDDDQSDIEILSNYDHKLKMDENNNIVTIEEDDNNITKILKLNAQKIDIRCPLSRCVMKIAWKATNCGHIFDKTTILKYIDQTQKYGKIVCPILGCSKMLRQNEFYNDPIVQDEIDKSEKNNLNHRKRKRIEIEEFNLDEMNLKKQRVNK